MAVGAIADGRIDVKPLLTEVVDIDRAQYAFERASDKRQSMKVQLAFG